AVPAIRSGSAAFEQTHRSCAEREQLRSALLPEARAPPDAEVPLQRSVVLAVLDRGPNKDAHHRRSHPEHDHADKDEGEELVDVPASLTSDGRRRSGQRGKQDEGDARWLSLGSPSVTASAWCVWTPICSTTS